MSGVVEVAVLTVWVFGLVSSLAVLIGVSVWAVGRWSDRRAVAEDPALRELRASVARLAAAERVGRSDVRLDEAGGREFRRTFVGGSRW